MPVGSHTGDGLSNTEIVVIAVYLSGGKTRAVDTEDVAVKADEIAPGRFSWRKYPLQISLDAVRKRLWDAKTQEGYLSGGESDGWMLTGSGVEIAEANMNHLPDAVASIGRQSKSEQRWTTQERARLLASDAFAKVQSGDNSRILPSDIETFFRLNDYIVGEARLRKVDRLRNAFGKDPELGAVVTFLASLILGSIQDAK